MRFRAPSALAILLLASAAAAATSWEPYQESIVTDSSGHYYVVVKRKNDGKLDSRVPVTLTFAEVQAGSAPMRATTAGGEGPDRDFFATVDPAIRVRNGDRVHGRIDLDQAPGVILVSTKGNVVTLDRYGFNNVGENVGADDLVIYSADGKVVHRKHRKDLFGQNARWEFYHGDGYLLWLDSAWFDEKRGDLVIVGAMRDPPVASLLSVSLQWGEVRKGGTELIDRAIDERLPGSLSYALELARRLRLAGSKKALPAILTDETTTLYVRLQAAVLLAAFEDRRGAELLKRAALDKPARSDWRAQYFAVANLPNVLGGSAAAILCDHIRRHGERGIHPAWTAMNRVPAEAAVPELRKLLDAREPVHAQCFALECLGNKGPAAAAAVPDIKKVLERGPVFNGEGVLRVSTHEYAMEALQRITKR